MGGETVAPTGFRYPDRPVQSESLYRLSYLHPLDPMDTTEYLSILLVSYGGSITSEIWSMQSMLQKTKIVVESILTVAATMT
jgi:hypothetical protein